MSDILVDVWLYGELALYGKKNNSGSYANLKVRLHENSTIKDLLDYLLICTNERGATFINGQLSAMPNIHLDINHLLHDGDRVDFFHLQSIWSVKYHPGEPMAEEMSVALQVSRDLGSHYTHQQEQS